MKTFALLLLFSSLPCCFGQTDTNLLATGDWSEAVSDGGAHAVRGRLLVYDDSSPSAGNHSRVYLELQNVSQGTGSAPIQVYCEFGWSLKFELRDQLDRPIPQEKRPPRLGPPPIPFWVTLPSESTVRLRADDLFLNPKPAGLVITVPGGYWIIPPKATSDFYLSATFTPLKNYAGALNYPSSLNYYVWQGTLKLPKVKIPAKKR